jgi:polyisoprenyl-teichoic acid--peptidoglycan teichoic acid transferase
MHNGFWDDDEHTMVNNPSETEKATVHPPEPNNSSRPPVRAAPASSASVPSAPRASTGSYYAPGLIPPPPPAVNRESSARERMRRRRVQGKRSGGEWAWVVIAGALLGVVIIISMGITLLVRASQNVPELLPTSAVQLPTPVNARLDFSALSMTQVPVDTGQQLTLSDGRSITIEPWNGTSRFTVLMMGLDRRPGETGLGFRTDTMMLISLDPATKSVGILSIPRDLYVDVPGYSELQRVNSPMVFGELQRPGYGPLLTMQTVQYNLGMRVNDYVAVDFNAFITLVDDIGGVDINVPYNISDPSYPDMYYGYDPLYISAGMQHMDGATALKFARTRHASSDFQRAERQQQVMMAVRDKILSLNMLPQLIIQTPSLFGQMSQDVYTGLNVDQLIQLAWYLKDVPKENIHTGVISNQYIMNYTTSQGAQVLIPNRSMLGELLINVFGSNYSE